ncbi:MAG: hypothetical protein AB7G93_18210 [Bdellovibrionales bacterium]
MKRVFLLLSFGLVIAISTSVDAAKKAKRKASNKARQTDLKTDVHFSDHDLHGQYQVPDEALAKVENEKSLSDLLGVRKHFKDRLLEASEHE